MKNHDPGSGLQPRNSGLKGPHTSAQPFLTSNGTWPTSLDQHPGWPLRSELANDIGEESPRRVQPNDLLPPIERESIGGQCRRL